MFDIFKLFIYYLKATQPCPFNLEDLKYSGCYYFVQEVYNRITLILQQLGTLKLPTFNPENFKTAVDDYMKLPTAKGFQDEFFLVFTETLSTVKLSLLFSPFEKIVSELFEFSSIIESICSECDQAVKNPINDTISFTFNPKTVKSLEDGMEALIDGEIKKGFCLQCKKQTDFTNRTLLNKAPNLIIIDINRFATNLSTFQTTKVTNKVEFPSEMDFYPYSKENMYDENNNNSKDNFKYNLYGIVTYQGSENDGYHTIYMKLNDEQWMQCTNSTVQIVPSTDVNGKFFGGPESNEIASVLLYTKDNLAEQSLSVLQTPNTQQFLEKYFDVKVDELQTYEQLGKKYYKVNIGIFYSLLQNYFCQ